MAEKIYVVSIGTGNPHYLTPAAKARVREAKYLAGGERNLKLFDTQHKDTFIIKNNLSQLKDYLQEHIAQAPVVLASGDAGFYGILKYLKRHFPGDKLEVIPGISSIQIAFAKLADTWDDAVLLSIHGRPLEDILALLGSPKIALLTDSENSPQKLADFLINHGFKPKELVALDNLTYPDEFIWRGTVQELVKLDKKLMNSVVVIYNE